MNRVLVVNSGSSSLKFKLYDVLGARLDPVVTGLLERIGDVQNSSITIKGADGKPDFMQAPLKTISNGLEHAFNILTSKLSPSVRDEVHAVGHRIVHGGKLTSSVIMDAEAKAEVKRAALFAPLHNPAQLLGVEECTAFFPGKTQVGVFDTAFHHTMPRATHTYALPYNLYSEHGVRKYGMHGTSYRYLVSETSKHLAVPVEQLNLIVAHIGSGSSMCCIRGGQSVNTSMGMTPLEGLVMGTRSGDVDPGMLPFLAARGMSIADIDKLMNKQSGLLGLCGYSDLRAVMSGAAEGDDQCKLAFEVFVERIRKYLGAYLLQLEGACQAVVFSAGIGENSAETRAAVCARLQAFGIEIDAAANKAAKGLSQPACISTAASKITVLVIPTDEELCIARDAAALAGVDVSG